MNQVHNIASLALFSLSELPARPGLMNPRTRFRKLLPYLGSALVVIIAVAGYATMRGMAASRDYLARTYEVKSELADLELNHAVLDEYALGARGLGENAQTELRSTVDAMHRCMEALKQLTRDDSEQQQLLGDLEPIAEQRIKELASAGSAALQESSSGHVPSRNPYTEQDAALSQIVGEINAREAQLLSIREAAWDKQLRWYVAVVAFALGACLLLLLTNMHLLRVDVRSSHIAAEHIRESADSYRALSARVIGLQDAERRRIGRELHDSVGQSLAALQMNLQQIASKGNAETGELLSESRDLVRRTAQDVRTISHLLHPPLLDMVGFVPAARNYTEQFAARSGIAAQANLPNDLQLPSKEAEMVLFRALQESLTNVHRHAQATAVDVWLERRGQEILLTIRDNGRGLPAEVMENFRAGMASGVGLGGMRERLAEFGGKLEVESSPKGTTVRAAIPG